MDYIRLEYEDHKWPSGIEKGFSWKPEKWTKPADLFYTRDWPIDDGNWHEIVLKTHPKHFDSAFYWFFYPERYKIDFALTGLDKAKGLQTNPVIITYDALQDPDRKSKQDEFIWVGGPAQGDYDFKQVHIHRTSGALLKFETYVPNLYNTHDWEYRGHFDSDGIQDLEIYACRQSNGIAFYVKHPDSGGWCQLTSAFDCWYNADRYPTELGPGGKGFDEPAEPGHFDDPRLLKTSWGVVDHGFVVVRVQ